MRFRNIIKREDSSLLAFHLIKLGLLIQRDEDGYNMSHEWARLNAYKILIKKPKT